jgi:hypothetical protein
MHQVTWIRIFEESSTAPLHKELLEDEAW